jgi:DNA mismatch endonuclease (patch repair protein)
MDTLNKEQRSKVMSRVGSSNTMPEIKVRKLLHGLGYRFRLHRRDLPGTPDIVLPGHRSVILVHGCFWHRHKGCRDASSPKTRREFWKNKFDENVRRDHRKAIALRRLGWRVVVVWECQLQNPNALATRLTSALDG